MMAILEWHKLMISLILKKKRIMETDFDKFW